jgi:hypothetical protein
MCNNGIKEGNDVIWVEHTCLIIKISQRTCLGASVVITRITSLESAEGSVCEHWLDFAVEG